MQHNSDYSTSDERVDLKDIKAIIDLMKKNSISEFELERQDFKIKLKRGGTQAVPYDEPTVVAAIPANQVPATIPFTTTPSPSLGNELEIKSPMIGTFYRAPS